MALATRRKPTTNQRKRQAGHHKHNKPYLKTYWPYLPMLLIVGVGLAVNSLWSSSAVLGSASSFSTNDLLAGTNAQRLANHEASLTLNPLLTAAAQAKANDMVTKNYWSHTSPDGQTPWTFITTTGYQYQSAGENLAYGFTSADDVITGWMNSPEHRANILDNGYQNVGFGIAESPNFQGKGTEVVIVAEYAQPAPAVANITFNVAPTSQNSPSVQGAQTELQTQRVSRVQLLAGGQAAWVTVAVSAMTGAALAIFVVRHGLRLKKLAFQGERFITNHPMLDIVVTAVITAGLVLTRSGGLIR